MIKGRAFTEEEEYNIYGDRKVKVNTCFYCNTGHYYLQRLDDVLHININKGFMLNTLHKGYLNEEHNYVEIPKEKFDIEVKRVIYENDLNGFWNSNEK